MKAKSNRESYLVMAISGFQMWMCTLVCAHAYMPMQETVYVTLRIFC